MRVHYFAFGSNMSSARLRARITSAQPVGAGRLSGWRFGCHKIGSDGSAKATILRHPGEEVWGVVFELAIADLPALDRYEGGYERVEVAVQLEEGALTCHTYVSDRVADHLVPFDWYKGHMVRGAVEHHLPQHWRAMLEALPARPSGG